MNAEKKRTARLQRLVRVTRMLYQIEAGELARASSTAADAAGEVASAEHYLEAEAPVGQFLAELAIVRAVRLRRQLAGAEAAMSAQVEVAAGARTKLQGVENRLDQVTAAVAKAREALALEEVVDRSVLPSSSLRQGARRR